MSCIITTSEESAVVDEDTIVINDESEESAVVDENTIAMEDDEAEEEEDVRMRVRREIDAIMAQYDDEDDDDPPAFQIIE